MNSENLSFKKKNRELLLDQISTDLDINTGFKNWSLQCQQNYKKQLPPPGDTKFHHKGYDIYRCFDEQQCKEIIDELMKFEVDEYKKSERDTESYIVPDDTHHAWLLDIFKTIFSKKLKNIIKNYFRSEFMIHTFRFNSHYKNDLPNSFSNRWHRDYTSNPHLKVIVYLTGCENTSAGTEVYDINTTHQINLNGYSYCQLERRVSDITPFIDSDPPLPKPTLVSPTAGHMILFRPRDILHRACYHQDQCIKRTTLSFMLAPSFLPWHETVQYWPIPVMQQLYGSTLDLTYAPAAKGEKTFRLDSR